MIGPFRVIRVILRIRDSDNARRAPARISPTCLQSFAATLARAGIPARRPQRATRLNLRDKRRNVTVPAPEHTA